MATKTITHPMTLWNDEFNADQHGYMEWLRSEAPVYRGRLEYLGDQDVYFVSRYQDCLDVLADPRIRRVVDGAEAPPFPESLRKLNGESMLYKDDPEHMRLRKLVSRSFTPRAIAHLTDRVQAVTRELLDGMAPGQRIDLLHDYALPIPTTVIAEMVGVREEDRVKFQSYIRVMMDGYSTYGLDGLEERMNEFVEFLQQLIDRRRAAPGEDILTELIQVRDEGDRLSDDEIIAMVYLLVMAGYETTYNLITNGVAALVSHPDQLARLVSHPELIDSAVEEMLRYTGTVAGTEPTTFAAEDITMHGVTIPRGALILPILASANRDPAEFPAPDDFDIARNPNRHLAFSKGNHFCLGASLARIETRIAIANLVARFPDIKLAVEPDQLRLRPIAVMTCLEDLPIVLG